MQKNNNSILNPSRDETLAEMTAPICYCGLELFFDPAEGKLLCPARFDGTHSNERLQEHLQKQLASHAHAIAAGAKGGEARAKNLTPYERRKIAQDAARARWNQKKDNQKKDNPKE
jgi:hypothetical protein